MLAEQNWLLPDALYHDSSDVKPIFIILVDISGYTRFIRFHKVSLLHAEKIIGELMESILKEVKVPVVAHEILGDAISLYAVKDGTPDQAFQIFLQIEQYFSAFRLREVSLVSGCKLCKCDACRQVGQLRLKAILHFGLAAFTKIQHIQKISGEDVIISHRLLKNSLQSDEYILMTRSFYDQCNSAAIQDMKEHREFIPDIGEIDVLVKLFPEKSSAPKIPVFRSVREFLSLEKYMIANWGNRQSKKYLNLPV